MTAYLRYAHIGVLIITVFVIVAVALQGARQRPPSVGTRAHITFGGDMLFDRSIRAAMGKKGGGFIFSCIDGVLTKADFVVANLEGPITAFESRSLDTEPGSPDNLTFTFPTSTAPLLFAHNIKLVNLGNNHSKDFGEAGIHSTVSALRDAGVAYIGDPFENRVAKSIVNSVPLVFISYNEFGGNVSEVLSHIVSEKSGGYMPVVYAHWGDEYTVANNAQRAVARQFVDAGAELVVGSHPHIVQEHEVYRGKHIYYSLGNFIFDQYWEESVRQGLLLEIVFGASGVQSIREIPIHLERDGRTCPIEQFASLRYPL